MGRQVRYARSAAAPPRCIRWTSSRRWPAPGSGSSGWGTRGRLRDTSRDIRGRRPDISRRPGLPRHLLRRAFPRHRRGFPRPRCRL